MSEKKQSPFRRFLGKIKAQQGQYGTFYKLLVDNPTPTKFDKSVNAVVADQYNKGVLLWLDNETGKKYLIKSLGIHGVSEEQSKRGFTSSISLDLDDAYQVQELE